MGSEQGSDVLAAGANRVALAALGRTGCWGRGPSRSPLTTEEPGAPQPGGEAWACGKTGKVMTATAGMGHIQGWGQW